MQNLLWYYLQAIGLVGGFIINLDFRVDSNSWSPPRDVDTANRNYSVALATTP